LEGASRKRKHDISETETILEGASRKRKHDISETETNSVKHKKSKKQRGKSESESDVDSIVDDEFERNSVLSFKHRRMENEKLWNKSIHPETVQDKYDVLISDDLKKVEDNIPPLSVYIGSGFAAEVKSFHTDVVLLAEVFENFRALSMNYFELDPVHFYTTPSLTWSAGIKTTNVTLELLTDIDMYLMLESGIRGGMCLVSKRFSKANNKYLEDFDEMSPSKYIISLDVNNLYGTAMAFYNLPESEFRFLDQNEIQEFDLMSVQSDSNVGYILEVDLYYPPELHSEHNSFPMAPNHETITFDMLSAYQKEICEKLNIKINEKNKKLLNTFNEKKNYRPPTPWKSIFTSGPVYTVTYAIFGTYWIASHFLSVQPIFLGTILHFSIQENGFFTSVPFAFQIVLTFTASWISKWLNTHNYVGVDKVRKGSNFLFCLGYSLCLLGVYFSGCERLQSTGFGIAAMCFIGLSFTGCMIAPVDMSPTFAGSVMGLSSTIGSLAAFIFPVLVGVMTDGQQTLEQWNKIFLMCIGIVFSSGILFCVFGSAEVQPWNYASDEDGNNREEFEEMEHYVDAAIHL
ncbi:Vesicular glutamate transporter 2, partial [Araneus ventricosus]